MRNYTDAELAQLLDKDIFKTIGRVADHLRMECYVVGGYVRDLFLERASNDIDVVVVGSGIRVAEELKNQLGRKAHLSVFRNFGTAQVKYRDLEVEFVGARKESYSHDSRKPHVEDGTLEDDQNRRDFTINALAICLNHDRFGELVDPFDGVYDMEDGIIRTPLDPDITFSDDPLRMLRCIRFATQLNFYIEDETFDALGRNAERIKIISGERVMEELNKIMATPTPSKGFVDLHDIGKTKSKRWDPLQGWTFHNHNFIGAKMVPPLFRRLKLPMDAKMKYVQKMVDLHMRPIVIADEEVTDSAVRRLINDAGDDIDDLMILCEADITSKNHERKQRFLDNFAAVRVKLADLKERDYKRLLQPVIDGNEIMEMFHLQPSREVGTLKQTLKDAVLDNRVPNEREPLMALLMEKARSMGIV